MPAAGHEQMRVMTLVACVVGACRCRPRMSLTFAGTAHGHARRLRSPRTNLIFVVPLRDRLSDSLVRSSFRSRDGGRSMRHDRTWPQCCELPWDKAFGREAVSRDYARRP